LLATWGGEAIYRYADGPEDRLCGLGTPAVVVAALD
jgi:hypothetical protein